MRAHNYAIVHHCVFFVDPDIHWRLAIIIQFIPVYPGGTKSSAQHQKIFLGCKYVNIKQQYRYRLTKSLAMANNMSISQIFAPPPRPTLNVGEHGASCRKLLLTCGHLQNLVALMSYCVGICWGPKTLGRLLKLQNHV